MCSSDLPRRGLSAVRNASLAAARGRFAIILDSDDMLHPRHLEGLVSGQASLGVEICAANMVEFQEEGSALTTRTFARGPVWQAARTVGLEEFVARGMIGVKGASLGYFKPLFDMHFLQANRIIYDERLRIGEDFDLVLRAMLAGARYGYLPQATYFYRRHAASTSHRLARADLEGLLQATLALQVPAAGTIASQLQARRENLEGALVHLDVVAAIKQGRLVRALLLAAGHRDARRLTLSSLYEAVAKRVGLPEPAHKDASAEALAHDETAAQRLHALALSPQPAVLSP